MMDGWMRSTLWQQFGEEEEEYMGVMVRGCVFGKPG